MPIRRRGGSGGTALSENIVDALEGAVSPAAGNPFATVGDLEESGADDKTVKASSTDETPGYLDAKVDGTTLEVSGDKLQIKSGGHTHSAATTSAAGLMSAADKAKLDGIAENANNYTHPETHSPSIITQNANNRFVTDAEKSAWNGKASTAVATTSANGLMSAADKGKLDGVSASAIAALAALTIASIESY